MIVYKLCRKLKDGNITSLFINKTERIEFNKWLVAESYPTKNFALRPGWHCTAKPEAPHLTPKGRVWVKVKIDNYQEIQRPESQGGLWFLAKYIMFLEIIENYEHVYNKKGKPLPQ